MDNSFVQVSDQGATSYVGADAVELARVIILKSALKILKAGMQPTRGFTRKVGLAQAQNITKKYYKGVKGLDQAIIDLDTWINAAKSSMPVIDQEGRPV